MVTMQVVSRTFVYCLLVYTGPGPSPVVGCPYFGILPQAKGVGDRPQRIPDFLGYFLTDLPTHIRFSDIRMSVLA